jgi:nucleotide-sensitive chloride channel 1A
MLKQISEDPPFVSEEEHARITACTPANFADIPPILRWGDEAEVEVGGEGWWDTKMSGKLWVTEEWAAIAHIAVGP